MEITRLKERLEAQRARLRRLFLLHGLCRFLLLFLFTAAFLFVVDYGMSPPRGVRLVLLVGEILLLIQAARRWILYPLSRPVTIEDMALALERRFPELDGALVSALQFHEDPDRFTGASSVLMERAVAFGADRAERVSWAALFDTKPVRRLVLFAGGALLAATAALASGPELAGIWLQRMAGRAVDWPRKTTLLVLLDEKGVNHRVVGSNDPRGPREVLVARGASLPVRIRVEGRDPGEVRVVMESKDTGRISARAVARGEGEYRYRFVSVRSDLDFHVEGGDDDGAGREVTVHVAVPPTVTGVSCRYRYPSYLELAEETRASPRIEGPEGTEVEARFFVSRPVKDASITVRTREGEETGPLERDPADEKVLRHTFHLARSGTYRLLLTSPEGFTNMEGALHSILVKKDHPPRIKPYLPARAEVDLCPRGVVVIRAVVEDDYGVREARIAYRSAGAKKAEVHTFTGAELDGRYPARRLTVGYALDFDAFPFPGAEGGRPAAPGDALVFTLEAFDTRPKREEGKAETGRFLVNIVPQNQKIRLLTERQVRLKEEVGNLRELQSERMEECASVLADLREGNRSVKEVVPLQIGQNQLTGRFRGVTREMAAVFDAYLFNRLDRTVAAETLLQRALEIRLSAQPREVFDPGLYTPLVEFYRSGRLGPMDLLDRLTVLLELCLKLSEDLSPSAAGFFGEALAAADMEKTADRVKAGVSRQEEILKTLDELLRRMEEWGDYQELLQLFRDTIDQQYNLNIMMREELRKLK